MLYEKLTAIAEINKWENLPSYQTVTRYISYLMEDENLKNAWYLAAAVTGNIRQGHGKGRAEHHRSEGHGAGHG